MSDTTFWWLLILTAYVLYSEWRIWRHIKETDEAAVKAIESNAAHLYRIDVKLIDLEEECSRRMEDVDEKASNAEELAEDLELRVVELEIEAQ